MKAKGFFVHISEWDFCFSDRHAKLVNMMSLIVTLIDIAITIIAIAICTNYLICSSLSTWILVKLCFKWLTKAPKDRGGLFQSCCLLSGGNVRHHHHQFTLTASPSPAVEKHRQNHVDSSGFTAWCNRKIKAEGVWVWVFPCCFWATTTFLCTNISGQWREEVGARSARG